MTIDVPVQPPRAAREPLATADGRVIGSIEPPLGGALADAGMPLRRGALDWRLAEADTTHTLAAIARWLHAHGHGGRWRDEQLAVEDDTGQAVGTIERAVVRPLGIATRAVHLVGCDPQGRVWVQQRALDKATDPGLWDTLMGGLMAAGETVATTLERETWEEAGLRIGELRELRATERFTIRRPVSDGYLVEHFEVYEAVVPEGLVPDNRDGEVAAFALIARDALRAQLDAGSYTHEAALILRAWLMQAA